MTMLDLCSSELRGDFARSASRHPEADVRVIDCEWCDGVGNAESMPYGYDPRDGSPLTHEFECSHCGGTGRQEIEMHPIEQEDLP
jgi:hypothetical protein